MDHRAQKKESVTDLKQGCVSGHSPTIQVLKTAIPKNKKQPTQN